MRQFASLALAFFFTTAYADFSFREAAPFKIDQDGFRIDAGHAEQFRFAQKLVGLSSEVLAPGTIIHRFPSKPLTPHAIRLHRFGEGFDLYFSEGLALRLSSLSAPFLSWPEGSVGTDLPTPKAPYVLVSFQDNQPPVLLTFPEAQTELKITGKTGQWVLRGDKNFRGWIRVIAPFGTEEKSGDTAATLGAQIHAMEIELNRWIVPAPNLVSVEANRTEEGLIGTWTFDRPNALLPPSANAAFDPKFKRHIARQSELGKARDGGPRWSKATQFHLLFPDSRWMPGRALTSNPTPKQKLRTDDAQDIINLAFANVLSSRTSETRQMALNELNRFAQRFPNGYEFPSAGTSPWLAASEALLGQIAAPKRRRDWVSTLESKVGAWSWDLLIDDEATKRRTMATVCIALALSDDPTTQLAGVMLDIALCEREKTGLRVMPELREALFGAQPDPKCALISPYRILTPQSLRVGTKDERLGLPQLILSSGEELQLQFPISMGPIRGTFLRTDGQVPNSSLWIARSSRGESKIIGGSFAPCADLALKDLTFSEQSP